ncbi:MAG TPA: family 10 glycosylhydrolase [Bacteroidota bacterium]|nr:family 10 glycosylhydrolase [Bacteroidota bacterium]
MHGWYRLSFLTALLTSVSFSQYLDSRLLITPPKREFRGAWIATVDRLDWPPSDPASQRNALTAILSTLSNYNFNAAVFQVRARGNAFYNSSYEPWAAELTDTLGKAPSYDPLQYAIDEARRLGLELHAWFNFAIVWNGTTAPTSVGKTHIASIHPEWVKTYNNQLWLDPGIPAVRDWLRMVALDLVRRYDIDAIHFDYIRIPDANFPDDDSFMQYGIPAGYSDKSRWRRENIDAFMRSFYDSAQIIRPRMKVGSAPIGIYSPIPGATSTFYGLAVGQDARKWMQEGKHDYVMPQIYWNIGEQTNDPDFFALAVDWQNGSFGRHVYPGLAAYQMSSQSGSRNYPVSDIMAMIDATRSIGSLGNVFFRYQSLRLKNFLDSLVNTRYSTVALLPLMPWKDNTPPNRPDSLRVIQFSNSFLFFWVDPAPASDGDTPVEYLVYRSTSFPVDISDMRNVVQKGTTKFYGNAYPETGIHVYTVTALDRNHNESERSSTVIVSSTGNVLVGVQWPVTAPLAFDLQQNYPNPFNSSTVIQFTMPYETQAVLKVYDLLGREVAVLVDRVLGAGVHQASFDAQSLPSGLYIYRLVAGGQVVAKKMQLVK